MRKIMQHRFLALLAMLMISLVSLASQPQGRKHHDGFNPKRFQAELEQFITTMPVLRREKLLNSSRYIDRWVRKCV